MDDPFANLTSSYIHKPAMKNVKKQTQPLASRPPAPQGQQSDGWSPNHTPSSPSSLGGLSSGKQASVDGAPSMKHTGSTGSLDSLSSLGLGMGSSKNRPMSVMSSTRAEPTKPAPAAPAPTPQQPSNIVTADDFDNMFGSISGGGGEAVDVFTGVPVPSSSADPFAMFDDLGGTAVSHSAASSPAATKPSASNGGGSLIPGFSEDHSAIADAVLSESQACDDGGDNSFTNLACDPEPQGASPQPSPHPPDPRPPKQPQLQPMAQEPPPPSYEQVLEQGSKPPNRPSSAINKPASPMAQEPPPPSYEQVLKQGSKPPNRSSSAINQPASPMAKELPPPSYEQVLEQDSKAPNRPSSGINQPASLGGSNWISKSEASADASLEKKLSQGSSLLGSELNKLRKEGRKLGGFLIKQAAKAVEQARDVVREHLHTPGEPWRENSDCIVESGGSAFQSRTPLHIKMADSLLSVDFATREAMLNAMDPADREGVEEILSRFDLERPSVTTPPAPASCPGADRPTSKPASRCSSGLDLSDLAIAGSATPTTPTKPGPPAAPSPAPPQPALEPQPEPTPPPAEEDVVDFLFSDNPHPAAAPAPATPASTPTGLEDLFETAPSSGRTTSHPDGMFGGIFGEEDGRSNVSGATTRVSVKVDSHETDTAERAALRQNRAQRVQDRIDKQLADKLARDRIEQEEQHQQRDLKSKVEESVKAWKKNANGNVVSLLATLHTVIWENSGWQAYSMGDLLSDAGVKKAWRKANLLVHPDKVKQKGGDIATIVLADMIFNTLKEAYGNYKPTGM